MVTNASNCPLCIAGQPGRHPDRGGTHRLMTKPVRHRPPVWTAAKDGLAHATQGQAPRTLCGAVTVPERLGYPHRVRCAVCATIAKAQR